MEAVKKYDYQWWITQLDQDEKRLKNDWWISADAIIKKYKGKKEATSDQTYLYNVFWANVGVLKAALFARPPKPMVSRVWADANDNIARVSALILQRCLSYDFMKNNSPMSEAIKLAVEDRLIPGLGLIWLRYEVETEMVTVPGTEETEGQEPVQFEVVSEEECECDYVHWRDVVFPSARTADELWYLGRKIYMTHKAFESKWGKVPKNEGSIAQDQDKILPKNFAKGKICIYELWCKTSKKVYWLCREINGWLKEKPDFLKLEGFYPCPKFLLATHTTDDYLPRPDYTMCRDQYDQLNELNTRIVILEKALRVVGVYDKKNAEVQRLLTDARENDMIPVDKWAVLAEAGGLKGVVDWFPIEMISNVLEKLTVQKQSKLSEIYELTGISDIMRGSTNPRETLGAQQLKSQYSSVRLQYMQMEVSIFVRQALIIKAGIICGHFQDETILKLSNIMSTPDAQYAEQALQLLRDSEMTEYKIDINEEGLALPDYNQEKQTRIEFLTTVGQFLSQAAPITAAMPGALPYLVQIVRWVAAGMRGSDEIQGVLDSAINSLQQPQAQPQQPQPDKTKVEQEQIKQQAETQRIPMRAQVDSQLQVQKSNLELRNAGAIAKMKAEHDNQAIVDQAMHENQQEHHIFVRDLVRQARDHQHELQLQREAPDSTQGG